MGKRFHITLGNVYGHWRLTYNDKCPSLPGEQNLARSPRTRESTLGSAEIDKVSIGVEVPFSREHRNLQKKKRPFNT